MNRPRVTVVIVTWNARPLLETCLPSVMRTRYPNVEVVLADNASTDGSAEWARSRFPDVRVIRHPENWGFCRGNNEAIRQTEGDYVVLLNNDVEVEPDWLDHLVDAAERDGSIAAVQPKLLQFDDRTRFEYAGAAGGHLDRYGYPFARGRLFFELETDTGQYDEPADIFWATGAAMLLRRSALDEVGLLEESFEFHMEEIDLCWRLRRAGFRIVCAPTSRAYHIGGGSLDPADPRKTYFNFRNGLLMLFRNLTPRVWRRTFAVRIVLDTLAIARFLALGEFSRAWAVIRAYAAAHRMKGRFRQADTAVGPSFDGSIAWEYYVRRRRRFSDLAAHRFRPPALPSRPD